MKPHTMNSPQAGEPASLWQRIKAMLPKTPAQQEGELFARFDACLAALTVHTDHPLRHWDHTCPACIAEAGAGAALLGEPVAWRSEVIAFANAMERKLRANDWKGGWKDDASGDLMSRVHQELREFIGAHLAYPRDTDKYRADLLDEGADVANMIMMVIDVCGGLPAPPGDERAPTAQAETAIPFAWYREAPANAPAFHYFETNHGPKPDGDWFPLYTSPPERAEPVSDADIEELRNLMLPHTPIGAVIRFARAILGARLSTEKPE